MKVILINPLENQAYKWMSMKVPPMGIMYIAAYLEKFGVPVEILDANILDYSAERVASEVGRSGASLVGVTATTATVNSALNVVREVRLTSPDAVTMVGGPHVTYTAADTLADCAGLDLVVAGEGEETALELAKALDGFSWGDGERMPGSRRARDFQSRVSGVRGIVYRDANDPGSPIAMPLRPPIMDLDSIPFPARHMVPFDRYVAWGKTGSIGLVMTSRGCPFACKYCVSSRMAGVKFRGRSAKNIVDEVEFIKENYGLDYIEFIDDIFTMSHRRVREVTSELTSRGMGIKWAASSRVNTINKELIDTMKKSGLTTLYFGVESGSQRVLDLMNKRITIEQARAAFRAARECNVDTIGSFILGYPGETLDEMKSTIRLSLELDPDLAQYTILTPYPGTPIYDELKAAGLLKQVGWESYTFTEPVIDYRAFGYSGASVKRMLIWAYARFYLRPSYMVRHASMAPAAIKTIMGIAKNFLF
jgi:radical SAM superfamily enzyme YgiQ (UPF0313 family)